MCVPSPHPQPQRATKNPQSKNEFDAFFPKWWKWRVREPDWLGKQLSQEAGSAETGILALPTLFPSEPCLLSSWASCMACQVGTCCHTYRAWKVWVPASFSISAFASWESRGERFR